MHRQLQPFLWPSVGVCLLGIAAMVGAFVDADPRYYGRGWDGLVRQGSWTTAAQWWFGAGVTLVSGAVVATWAWSFNFRDAGGSSEP